MSKSLQDQLLKAGLVDKKKVTKANQQKRKQAKQQQKGQQVENQAELAAKQARADKAEKDRQLNQEREKAAQEKAIQAQIKQMILTSQIDRSEGEISYSFTDGVKVKQILVTQEQQNRLSWGQIAIARLGEDEDAQYYLVPKPVSLKISERSEQAIVVQNDSKEQQVDEDDPYADYQIPDDLMW